MPTSDGPTSPGFWRCVKCGTPNPGSVYIRACVACGYPRPPAGLEPRAGAEAPAGAPGPRGRFATPRLLVAVLAYGAVLLAAFLLARGVGDAWWPGFLLAVSPRALFLLPLAPLAAAAWRARRPMIGLAVACEALFVAGPLMGFVVPWARLAPGPAGPSVRIMTFNRGGAGGYDTASFLRYIERMKVDVVCFQEMARDPMLDQALAERGWHRDRSGSIASRFPIVEDYPRSAEVNEPDFRYTAILYRARVRGPEGREFVVGCLHMPTARYALRRLRRLDPSGLAPFVRWWGAEFARMFDLLDETGDRPVLVGGDFNAGTDASELAAVLDSGRYRSAFDTAGLGWGYTRPSGFPFVRIDHILASPHWSIRSCWAGPPFGSDHRSMLADVALSAKP